MSLEAYYEPFKLERDVPADAATGEPCRELVGYYKGFIQPVSGNERGRFAKVDEEYTHRCYCPLSVPAVYGDVVTRDTETWTVVFATQEGGISRVGHHKELLLEQI